MGKYGTNLEGFGGFEGGVNADKGAPLVSTSSDGETALLFGPAALREIQAGVANGDFAIPPDEADQTITSENPLPYWTFTDDDSAGAITCKVVTAATGNSILWTVAANTPTGKTATLSRYVAVPSTQDKAYAFYPEFYVASTTNATSRNIIFTLQYYTADFVTTGTAITRTYPFSDFTSSGASAVFLSSDTSSRLTVPTNARFARISIQVDTTGTNASASTLTLSEVKMLTAYPMLLVADRLDGGSRGPASIFKTNNKLTIAVGIPTNWTLGDISTTENNIEISTSLIRLRGNSRAEGTFEALSTAAITGLLTASAGITATGLIATERASALNEAFTARQTGDATARFALYSNGAMEWGAGGTRDLNLYRASAGVLATDFALAATNISLSGSQGVRHDTPATTTQTSSAGIWVLVSGTNYQLRRNSSSARYKTNIVDADEVVLEAARKVKPRHYESTIEDENGATRLGFIAEEIHESGLTHAVGYDAEGKPETIDPTALIAALWHRVNDLEDRLKALEEA